MTAKNRRDVILQAALELIAERGFHGAPMSLVAQRAGASAGIIYHYFASKDDIIHALYTQIEADLRRALLLGDLNALPLEDACKRMWLNAYHFYRSHPQAASFLEQYKHSPYYQEDGTADDLIVGEEFGFLATVFNADPAERPFKDLPLDVIYELTFGVAARVARRYSGEGNTLSDAVLDRIATACWQAIAR